MPNTTLKRALSPIHLWAIAVGLVISGEYFGWNYGWGAAGTVGFLIATVIVTILYITFIFSFTELTTSIPHSGGPFEYSRRALGPFGGLVAGYATLIEFLFATPAIAFALGSYLHFLDPFFDELYTAIACYLIFSFINYLGIKESAVFTLVVTLLAVAELLLFIGIVSPHFRMERFMYDSMPHGYLGIFAALPFAIWFYLAIEGVAMVAEESKDPHRTIPIGYISGIATLAFLAIGIMVVSGGITDWHRLANIDYPLPEAIGIVMGKDSSLTKLFAGIGLFGLIASFHSIILGYSRQLFALARGGYLPRGLARIHPRFHTPHVALIVGGIVGIIAVCSGTTQQLIVLSALGAVVMYVMSMVSLFVLRRKEPDLERPFRAPFYPIFPAIALFLSVICLLAIVVYNFWLSVLFFVLLGAVMGLFVGMGMHRKLL
ncbi:ethanolamine permease [Haliscomenobacter hydrossis]|uniref:Ethanolamine transporter n=1 Tax=Haliscomenobacter hydrossis (strain ATCC 27775 / DSM 1100 / LMG 10767 / O) TaxID=760192 RepID=F4L0I1_HALH1|nr:ethanolamine permease [Haliscomenobacter hydrossis]AEE48493.1 ethanolamine transporter [Haliscomenobacter hydrossis DSM 1100]